MTLRVQIRPKVYRGVPGFSVIGCEGNGWGARIFCHTREGAEVVKAALKVDHQAGLPGFAHHDIPKRRAIQQEAAGVISSVLLSGF